MVVHKLPLWVKKLISCPCTSFSINLMLTNKSWYYFSISSLRCQGLVLLSIFYKNLQLLKFIETTKNFCIILSLVILAYYSGSTKMQFSFRSTTVHLYKSDRWRVQIMSYFKTILLCSTW